MKDEATPEKGAEEAAPEETKKAPEPEVDEGEESQDEAPAEGGEKPEKPKKPNGYQKRIAELTKNWRNTQRQNDQLMKLLEQQRQQPEPAAQPQAQPATKPSPDRFNTNEDYLEALAEWKADQKWEQREKARREAEEKKAREEAQQSLQKTWAEREQKAREKYEDYEDVALADETPITPLMAEVIRRSELGPDIAYFIGQNPDKGLQIAQMTDPHGVALAIGRIEAQIEAANSAPVVTPTPKAAPTAAPPPPKTLSGSAPVKKEPDQMTVKEWMAWRNSQLNKKRA